MFFAAPAPDIFFMRLRLLHRLLYQLRLSDFWLSLGKYFFPHKLIMLNYKNYKKVRSFLKQQKKRTQRSVLGTFSSFFYLYFFQVVWGSVIGAVFALGKAEWYKSVKQFMTLILHNLYEFIPYHEFIFTIWQTLDKYCIAEANKMTIMR